MPELAIFTQEENINPTLDKLSRIEEVIPFSDSKPKKLGHKHLDKRF